MKVSLSSSFPLTSSSSHRKFLLLILWIAVDFLSFVHQLCEALKFQTVKSAHRKIFQTAALSSANKVFNSFGKSLYFHSRPQRWKFMHLGNKKEKLSEIESENNFFRAFFINLVELSLILLQIESHFTCNQPPLNFLNPCCHLQFFLLLCV